MIHSEKNNDSRRCRSLAAPPAAKPGCQTWRAFAWMQARLLQRPPIRLLWTCQPSCEHRRWCCRHSRQAPRARPCPCPCLPRQIARGVPPGGAVGREVNVIGWKASKQGEDHRQLGLVGFGVWECPVQPWRSAAARNSAASYVHPSIFTHQDKPRLGLAPRPPQPPLATKQQGRPSSSFVTAQRWVRGRLCAAPGPARRPTVNLLGSVSRDVTSDMIASRDGRRRGKGRRKVVSV